MKIYDITLPMKPDMAVWPGNPPVQINKISSMDQGAHDNVSWLGCCVHTGTHVDSPHHFLNDHRTVDMLFLDVLIGPALVVEVPESIKEISSIVLKCLDIPLGTTRLLLKTSNSRLWKRNENTFVENYVGLSLDGAKWLVDGGIQLVGIDYLSIAPYHQGIPIHQSLLFPGIVIIEGLDLGDVPEGIYNLFCLPLKLVGSDGAPARVVLIKD
jgi:arylformamidase